MKSLTKRLEEREDKARISALYQIILNFQEIGSPKDELGPDTRLQATTYILQHMGFIPKFYDFSGDWVNGPHSVQLKDDEIELATHNRILELSGGGEIPERYVPKEAYLTDYFTDHPLSADKKAPRVVDILKEASIRTILNLSKVLRYSEVRSKTLSLSTRDRREFSSSSGVSYHEYRKAMALHIELINLNPKTQVFI